MLEICSRVGMCAVWPLLKTELQYTDVDQAGIHSSNFTVFHCCFFSTGVFFAFHTFIKHCPGCSNSDRAGRATTFHSTLCWPSTLYRHNQYDITYWCMQRSAVRLEDECLYIQSDGLVAVTVPLSNTTSNWRSYHAFQVTDDPEGGRESNTTPDRRSYHVFQVTDDPEGGRESNTTPDRRSYHVFQVTDDPEDDRESDTTPDWRSYHVFQVTDDPEDDRELMREVATGLILSGYEPEDKRQWNGFSGSWGKRAAKWNNFAGSWGKRSKWNSMGPSWGKRAKWDSFGGSWGKRGKWENFGGSWGKRKNWDNFNGAWGKRKGWDSFSGGWGKRAAWNKFGGSWGKRDASVPELQEASGECLCSSLFRASHNVRLWVATKSLLCEYTMLETTFVRRLFLSLILLSSPSLYWFIQTVN